MTNDPNSTPPTRVAPGQQWRTGRSVWTVTERRGRAQGFQEALLLSPGGARRWVMESDLLEDWVFVGDEQA